MRERGRNWTSADEERLINIINAHFETDERRYSDEWWTSIEETFNMGAEVRAMIFDKQSNR